MMTDNFLLFNMNVDDLHYNHSVPLILPSWEISEIRCKTRNNINNDLLIEFIVDYFNDILVVPVHEDNVNILYFEKAFKL